MSASSSTARNLLLLTSASIVQIVVQFLIQAVLAYQYGAKADADALSAALALPTFLAAVVTGSLGYVLVPELVSSFSQSRDESKGWQVAGLTGLLILVFGLLFSGLLYISADFLSDVVGIGFSDSNRRTAIKLLQILSVQVLFNCLIGWAQAVHHSRHSFLIPALGGVLGTLLTLWLTWTRGHTTIFLVAWAINAGSAVSVLVHLPPLIRCLVWPRIEFAILQRLAVLIWPLLIGNLYLRIEPIIDRRLTSELYEGAVRQLDVAQRIIAATLLISASGLAVIALPQLADRLAKQGKQAFVEHFALAVRRLILIVTPILIGLSFYSTYVIADLLERGKFTHDDSRIVGTLIVGLLGFFLAASTGELLSRGFYILGDTRTPTLIGAGALTLGIIAKLLLVDPLGIWGLALAASGSYVLSATTMAVMLRQRTSRDIFRHAGKYAVQASLASLVACAICSLAYLFNFGRSLVAIPVAGGVYVLVLMLLRNRDALDLRALIEKKIGQAIRFDKT